MKQFKVGDYFISKLGNVYRIVDSYSDSSGSLYDIRSLKSSLNEITNIKCLNQEDLMQAGIIIPEEKLHKLIKLLFIK